MSDAQGETWASSGFEGRPRPNVYVQWKGTEVCLDFYCECGYTGHYDGGFAYGLKCGECGRIWTMPHTFGLIAGGGDGAATRDTDWPHQDGAVRRMHPDRIEEVATVADDPDHH